MKIVLLVGLFILTLSPINAEEGASMITIWPDVFLNAETVYTDKREALADAYSGWGLASAGAELPKNFGAGMAFIGEYLGISPVAGNLDKLYKELM